MIILTEEQASHIIYRDQFYEARLRPLLLSNGTYGVPDSVLTDPRHARWRSILKQGTIVADNTVTTVNTGDENNFQLTVNGKTMTLGFATGLNPARAYTYPQRGVFDVAATNTYRFATQYNNDHLSYDWQNNRRRSEIASLDSDGPNMGDTFWASWATILTDQRESLVGPNATLIHQWFKTPVAGSTADQSGPFVYIALASSKLEIATRSSSTPYTSHYNSSFNPSSGTPTYFVVSGLLGQSGHLNVWMNGTKIVNVDVPLGFYSVSEPNNPAYLHIATGIYQANTTDVTALYHANIEFGTTDLTARIASPLAINTPPGGWV